MSAEDAALIELLLEQDFAIVVAQQLANAFPQSGFEQYILPEAEATDGCAVPRQHQENGAHEDYDVRQRKKLKENCHACIAAKVSCTGVNDGSRCPRCEREDFECVWDVSTPKARKGAGEGTTTEVEEDGMKHMLRTIAPPGKHLVIYPMSRRSSVDRSTAWQHFGLRHGGAAMNFSSMMDDPAQPLGHPHLQNLPHRAFGTVLVRHDTHQVPTQVHPVAPRPLQAWVRDLHTVFDPKSPNLPEEIFVLTFGPAGCAVNIRAWGDRNSGFMGWALRQNRQLAKRVFLAPIVKPSVVQRGHQSSLGRAGTDAVGWYLYHNCYCKIINLLELIDRHTQRRVMLNQGISPINPLLPRSQHEVEHDEMLDALRDEYNMRGMYLLDFEIPLEPC